MVSRFPTLTSAQVRQIDQSASERFGIQVGWLMEAAGWQVARHCRARTYVVCGKGNNGGDGLAAARHLHRWNWLEGVVCLDPERLAGPAAEEARALLRLGVEIDSEPQFGGAEIVLDALLGTGLSRAPDGPVADWIGAVNDGQRQVVAVDVPSGLDADSGVTPGPCVKADLTVTLGLPKPGLLTEQGARQAGVIWVADIGIPDEVYVEAGIQPPGHLFASADQVLLA